MMGSSGVGTGKSPDWSDFHPCRSRQSLAIAPRVSRLDLSSARATFKRNNLSHAGEKMLVCITARMERRALVLKKKKKKKKKRKKVRVPGVIFEALWQRAQMGGLCTSIISDLLSVRQVTKVGPNQTSTPFTEPTQESNTSSSSFFFYSPPGSLQINK